MELVDKCGADDGKKALRGGSGSRGAVYPTQIDAPASGWSTGVKTRVCARVHVTAQALEGGQRRSDRLSDCSFSGDGGERAG